jgi:flagellar biosynthetic protein FliR
VLPPGTIAAFGLYLVRTSAMVLASPLLGGATSVGSVKVALIAALSLVCFAVHGGPVPEAGEPLVFAAFALRELAIGLALGFVVQCVLLAVRVAGEMIGQEMALNMSSVADPVSGVHTPLVTQLYEGFFLLGLFALDAHHVLLRALARSFERAPVGRLGLESGLAAAASRLFADLFAAGLTLAAPVLALLFLTSIAIGLLARVVPHLNVLDVGFTLRILVGLAALYLFAPLIAPAIEGLAQTLDGGVESVLLLVEG